MKIITYGKVLMYLLKHGLDNEEVKLIQWNYLTWQCPVCDTYFHKEVSSCKECGVKFKKGE